MQKRVSQRFRHQIRVTSVKNHPTLLTTHYKESYWLFHSEEKLITDTIGFSFDVFWHQPKKSFCPLFDASSFVRYSQNFPSPQHSDFSYFQQNIKI
jgi:hypothetical protein